MSCVCVFRPLSVFCVLLMLGANTGWERLIRSHSSARFYFELSGNSNEQCILNMKC